MLKSDQNAVIKVCWDGKCSCSLDFSVFLIYNPQNPRWPPPLIFLKSTFYSFLQKNRAASFKRSFQGAEFNYGIICFMRLTCYPKSNMAVTELLKTFFPNEIAKMF